MTPAQAAGPISSATIEMIPVPVSTVDSQTAVDCQGVGTCDTPVTLHHGGSNQHVRLTGFDYGGDTFQILDGQELGQAEIQFLRVDNANVEGDRENIFIVNPSPSDPSYDTGIPAWQQFVGPVQTDGSMASALADPGLTVGTDNLFANQATGPNPNNIERLSLINRQGMFVADPGKLGVMIAERGGNDSFKIAAVTEVDPDTGEPTAWGPIVTVSGESSNWGTILPSVTSTVLMRTEGPGTPYRPSAWTNTQRIAGVYVGYDDLGVSAGTTIYGVSLVGGDESSMEEPWNTNTPYDGNGGLDLVSVAFASANDPGLHLEKTSDPEPGTTLVPGDTVTYTVELQNIGNVRLDPVDIHDDLSQVLNNATYNNDVHTEVNGVPVTDGTEATIIGDELTWLGTLEPFQSIRITYSVTIDDGAGGELIQNRVTASGTPPPGLPPITPPPVETEHPVVEPGFDITKAANPPSGSAVVPGQTIEYTVTGTNSGDTVLDPATIADDLSAVLAHAQYNDDVSADLGIVDISGETLAWTGMLEPGQTVTITYSVTVDDDASGVVLNNVASGEATPQIPEDPSDPDSPTTPGEPIEPDDVITEHPVVVPGFEIAKTADPISGSSVFPGQTIEYTVTGTNTGDTVLDPASIFDDLSGVLAHAGYNDDVTASIGHVTVTGSDLEWTGVLQPGQDVTIIYSVTVDGDAAGVVLENTASGEATPLIPDDPTDPDSPTTPGDIIEPPPVGTEHPVPSPGFVLDKSADPASGTAVNPGGTIQYTVTGTNTGDTGLSPVVITDDLSGVLAHAELTGSPVASINGSGAAAPVLTGTDLVWTGALAVGETVTITYSVTVDVDAGGETLHNVVTGEGTPPGGGVITPPPGETEHPVNEPGFEIGKSSDPASGSLVAPGDQIEYTVSGSNTGGIELDVVLTDDLSGVAGYAAYQADATATIVDGGGNSSDASAGLDYTDDALTWTGTLQPGERVEVTYSVIVNDDARGQVLENRVNGSGTPPGLPPITPPEETTEHPVPGFELAKASDPTSGSAVVPGDTITYTVTGENTGATSLDVTVEDDLSEVVAHGQIQGLFTGVIVHTDGTQTNVSSELSFLDGQLTWSGTLQAGETIVIGYSVTVDGDVEGEILRNTASGEAEPPSGPPFSPPPVTTEHPVPGFELGKSSDPASGSLVAPGDDIEYTVTGINTGATALDPVVITDDLADVVGAATYNTDAAATVIDADGNETSASAGLSHVGTTLTWTGSLEVGERVEIVYTVTVEDGAEGEVLLNRANGEGTPPGLPPITPPEQATEHPVPGFDLAKVSDPASGSAVVPGDTITYIVTGGNTGATVLDPVTVTDDLTGVIDFAEYQGDAAAEIIDASGDSTDASADLDYTDGELTWTGALQPGERVEITYSVIVDDGVEGETLENRVTGSGTPPGEDPLEPPPVTTEHPVPGFELDKSSDPASGSLIAPADEITYTVTGANTGATALDPVTITDDLSGVADYAEYQGNATATITDAGGNPNDASAGLSLVGTTLTWTGQLQIGESVEITYSVIVNDDAEGEVLRNRVSGEGTPPGLPPITPPEEETEHPVPGFNLGKSADPVSGSAVQPGDTITYTVTGTNSGTTVLDPVTVTDDLTGVVDHAEYQNDATATIIDADGDLRDASAGLSLAGDELSWNGVLQAGERIEVTYSVIVDDDVEGETLENRVNGSGTPPGQPPLTPPEETTEHHVPGFELSKSSDPVSGSAVQSGDQITYTVTGTNTGAVALDPVTIDDDLSDVVSYAEYQADAVATVIDSAGAETNASAGLTVTDDELAWTGVLEPGERVEITYSVIVNDDAEGAILGNTVSGEGTPPGLPPVTPPSVTTEHPVPGFDLDKSADPASGSAVQPGDVITYTVTGTNTGAMELEVNVDDDLSGVAAYAEHQDDATAAIVDADGNRTDVTSELVVAGDSISWSGTLQPGERIEVTYSVIVDDGVEGAILENEATGDGTPPGLPPITPPPATTEHPVPGFELSKSADPASGSVVTAGDAITYTVTGTNTGATELEVELDDDLSRVIAYAEYQDDAAATIIDANGVQTDASADLNVSGGELTWSGTLQPGERVEVTYSVIVDDDVDGETLENEATGEGTPPGLPPLMPPPVTTVHHVPGFEIAKSSDPASGSAVIPGETITYTVTGTNTGQTLLDPVTINDDLAGVVEYATYNDDATASLGSVQVVGDQLTWSGSLDAGESVTITYSVTVTEDGEGEILRNIVTGSATPVDPENPDVPQEPIEPPEESTEHPVPAFGITKSADPAPGSVVRSGDRITYTVSGFNSGATELDVELADDLSGVTAYAEYQNDVAAVIVDADGNETDASAGLSLSSDDLAWSGVLQPGERVSITYSVIVDDDVEGETLENRVTGSGTPPGEPPLVPPPVTTMHHVPGFEISKDSDPVSGSQVSPGDVITYTVTGINTGGVVLDPVLIDDDLSGVLEHATYNRDVSASHGVVRVDGDLLMWDGSLDVGEQVTITYSVTVNEGSEGETLENIVWGSATPVDPNDPDEPQDPIEPPEESTEHTVDGDGDSGSSGEEPPLSRTGMAGTLPLGLLAAALLAIGLLIVVAMTRRQRHDEA